MCLEIFVDNEADWYAAVCVCTIKSACAADCFNCQIMVGKALYLKASRLTPRSALASCGSGSRSGTLHISELRCLQVVCLAHQMMLPIPATSFSQDGRLRSSYCSSAIITHSS